MTGLAVRLALEKAHFYKQRTKTVGGSRKCPLKPHIRKAVEGAVEMASRSGRVTT